jgi:penicillin-binding protein 1C
VGNVNNHGNANLAGSKAAAPLLIDIFNTISPSHEKEILPRPKDLLYREVCATSGHLPTPQCKRLIEDEYSVLRTQDIPCEIDKEYLLSRDGSMTYCMSCLGNNPYVVTTIQEFPPDLLSFWERMGAPYQKPPRHNPECTRLFSDGRPRITSPSDNMTYYLVSRQQKIVLQASSGIDVTQYLWYLDDRFLRRARVTDKPFLALGEGDHKVTCVDDKGRTTSVSFKIRFAM